MVYRKAKEIEIVPIENCMGGEGTVRMQKLLDAPAEMLFLSVYNMYCLS